MTTAPQAETGSDDGFVTLNLVGPVEALQQELMRQEQALPAVFAVREAALALKGTGLRHLAISIGRSGGLLLECAVPSEVEDQHEPTQTISVFLRRAANEAGGWVESMDFVPADADEEQTRGAGQT